MRHDRTFIPSAALYKNTGRAGRALGHNRAVATRSPLDNRARSRSAWELVFWRSPPLGRRFGCPGRGWRAPALLRARLEPPAPTTLGLAASGGRRALMRWSCPVHATEG